IGIGNVAFQAILTSGIAEAFLHDGQEALLQYHISPALLAVAGVTGLAWVLFSAYGTGMRIIRMSPIQAISNRSNKIMKVRKHSLFGFLFGWKGRLASRNNRRQPKRFIITVLSLTLSMTLFASVSYIMNVAQIQTNKIFEQIYLGIEFDFMVSVDEKPGTDGMPVTIQKIEESGYFKNICYDISRLGKNGDYFISVDYVNEATYLRQFKNEPPISYEELKQSGGYLYSSGTEFSGDTFTVQKMYKNKEMQDVNLSYPVVCKSGIAPVEKSYLSGELLQKYIWLYAPIEFYENSEIRKLYADEGINYSFTAFLNDTREHDKALDFLKSLDTVNMEELEDAYLEHRKADTVYSAIEIGFTFLNIMFTLIAVFNMVNIISTGILNRKSEFASLQCIGMTRGQLYSMTVLECLQYAVTSGALALGLCETLLWLTQKFLLLMEIYDDSGEAVFSMKKVIDYGAPVPKILIAMIFAFAVAFVSSLIPLKMMEKIPLTDQIRSVD
ncbi:MAG: ABC transporter permease, partial [Ruminococcus sp.]|nr:ABC transporter permease [Ruminococcus sp.]